MTEISPCVLIMAGGTGGHIYPALAVAKELQARDIRTVWLGSKTGLENTIVPQNGIRLIRTLVSGLRGRGALRLIFAPILITISLFQSVVAMLQEKPDLVLGMGGFASGPGGVAAWLCRKPLFIHEQNARPGLTNALLSRIAIRVFQAFPNTFVGRPAETVGNPVRREIRALPPLEQRQHEKNEFRVLVIGGSRGAKALNEHVPLVLSKLENAAITIWHQTGQANFETTQVRYQSLNCAAKIEAYIEDMAAAYAWSDVLICRAGAMTVSEIMVAGTAAIFVPFPYATDDHQTQNANYLVEKEAALMVPEGPDFADQLTRYLSVFIKNRSQAVDMARRAHDLAIFDAADKISTRCCEVIHG